MRIAIDGMGGDNAPHPEIEGIRLAIEASSDLEILLVGKPEILDDYKGELDGLPVEIVEAKEVVGMHELPSQALRRKSNSSIARAVSLVKENKADAVVSAGNTGAIMAFALSTLGTIPGVARPALGQFFPTLKGSSLVLDIGANVDTKPKHLLQFGIMGSVAASHIMKKVTPTVGLLNIGKESLKGNELVRTAYVLFEQSDLEFVGNIEAYDVLKGDADVVVCDGFVGNVMLKFGEGFMDVIGAKLTEYLSSQSEYRIRRRFSKPVLFEFISSMDYEETGGALLLGVNGTVVIGHGRSTAKAIKNAIKTAHFCSQAKLTEELKNRFQV